MMALRGLEGAVRSFRLIITQKGLFGVKIGMR